ncbi:somatostatin receptor type 1-like [Puntigrus tetrazona]|uniref:somatostatin receptor type 1-like n=1 Tax=Puntigrus tetrazona TaxID=1606681 RepID=UPI001C89132F|nr:somatostatin receptor type 1-like [Puntigrus tetrazona]XP_043114491.1 somatostatin receptor type 1-like [Puntigrus tetrazona]
MNNSTVNFTTAGASTTLDFGLLESQGMSILLLVGLPIHSYIIWLIITGAGSGVASEFFTLNLSVCEIGNSVNAIFGILSYFYLHFKMLTQFLQGLGVAGRPLFQCLICVERYLAVVHPVTFLKYKPLRYRVICSAEAWIICLGSCLVSFFSLVLLDMKAYVWILSLHFLIFFFIQLFCLVAVLRALKQSGPGERGREKKEENRMKRRAFYLILITTMNMIILYVPYTVTGFFVIVTHQNIFDFWSPACLCYVLAGFVQPIFYLQRAGKLFCLCSS